jgi:hypothetical protein
MGTHDLAEPIGEHGTADHAPTLPHLAAKVAGWDDRGHRRGRRAIVLASLLVLVVVIVGVGVVMFGSLAGESQSYKDGYPAGGTAFTSYGSADEDALQACSTTELRRPSQGGRPPGDVSNQWLQGCEAGFNTAQSDN